MTNRIALRFLDKLGTDKSIAETARVCTDSEAKLLNVEKTLNSLMKLRHWSPFEQAVIQYEIHVPIFVARQWTRHQEAQMERSLRYTKKPQLYGGHSGVPYSTMTGGKVLEDYEELITLGTKPEDARRILPVETMTMIRLTVDLRTAMNMINQRLDSHAQAETQELAGLFTQMVQDHFPLALDGFLKWNYQDFSTNTDDLRKIMYILENADMTPIRDVSAFEAIERFIDAGKKRIETVKGARSFIDGGVKDRKIGSSGDWLQQELGL